MLNVSYLMAIYIVVIFLSLYVDIANAEKINFYSFKQNINEIHPLES